MPPVASLAHHPAHPGAGGSHDARFIPGTTIAARYRIVGLLGRGGMGEVYRADDLKLGQPVALKFLPSQFRHGDRRFDRLLSEVRLARQVSHPNVCRVYDAGEVDGQQFLSMEYIDGENLASLLRRIGRLPKDKAIELARQLCAGLNAAHEQGILHRDLKPANVMIDGRGRAKITDFGLAALARENGGEDPSAGTPAYMSPEQLAGREFSARSDLYALGLVLYELFTGKPPFSGRTLDEIIRQRGQSTPGSPSDQVEGFDPAVERAILRCLENDPNRRPGSALAVAAALPGGDPLAAALAAGETPSPEMVAAAGESESLRPARAILLALAAVVLFATGITIEGRRTLRARLPMDKPPAVMIDRAATIIAELGYTEPVHAEPADTAIGYSITYGPIDDIRLHDQSSDRWERLRDPDEGVLSFWYRQSPRPLVPGGVSGGPGLAGRVDPWNPFPRTTGEIMVSLGPDGRLVRFVAVPRRFSEQPAGTSEFDWSLPFRLAGLDPADFEPAEPRYQRFMQHDLRAAWRPRDPEVRYRIEAGVNEGRLSLFTLLDREEAERLAGEPEELSGSFPDIFGWFIVAISLGAAFVARANLRRGRADRRGALRLGLVMGGLMLLADLLAVHNLLNMEGFFLPLTRSITWGVFTILIYLALEPFARATWPTLLASWNRLSGPAGGWRDPGIGRSVLGGLTVGCLVGIIVLPIPYLVAWWDGAPGQPEIGSWTVILDQKEAWGAVVMSLSWSFNGALVIVFLLVFARRILKRPAAAIVAAFMIQCIPTGLYVLALSGDYSAAEIVASRVVVMLGYAGLIYAVLHWGLVGAVAMRFIWFIAWWGLTPDWGAWHARPGILATIAVAALALYGAWAATPAPRRAQ